MEEWLSVARAVSTEVKLAWFIWLTWTVVQFAWYRHAKGRPRRTVTATRPLAVPLKRPAIQHTTWSQQTAGSPELLAGLGLLTTNAPAQGSSSVYGAPMTDTERADHRR